MKTPTTLDQLALWSGHPIFPEALHVGRPNLGDRDRFLRSMEGVFDRVWLTNHGKLVQDFEARLQEITGARHCLAMNNGTIGLEILLRAAGIEGEVLVPSFTFVATTHALRWLGIDAVFCDIAEPDGNLDPARLEDYITPRTSAILGVHLWGRICDVDGLAAVAERHGLQLLFDAAHAFGCAKDFGDPRGVVWAGNFGRAEIYSFHATKFVNCFEGGAVVTNDDALAERVRLMRNFGFAGYDNVVCLGTNGKMSEASAAMGLNLLESMDEIIDVNRRNYHGYREIAGKLPGVDLMAFDESAPCNYQYVVARVGTASPLTRDELLAVLHSENILARRYFYPGCHRMEPYRGEMPEVGARLPVTERFSDEVVVLPTGTAMDAERIAVVGEILRLALENADAVRAKLAEQAQAG